MRKIQASADRGPIPIRDRAYLILGKSIPVKCRPVAKFRQSIGPIHSGTPVARILQAPRQSVANPKNAMSERCKRQWNAGATLDSGSRKSKFEISSRLEAESFPMK